MRIIDNFLYIELNNKIYLFRCDEKKIYIFPLLYKVTLQKLVENNFLVTNDIADNINNLVKRVFLKYE